MGSSIINKINIINSEIIIKNYKHSIATFVYKPNDYFIMF